MPRTVAKREFEYNSAKHLENTSRHLIRPYESCMTLRTQKYRKSVVKRRKVKEHFMTLHDGNQHMSRRSNKAAFKQLHFKKVLLALVGMSPQQLYFLNLAKLQVGF